MSYIPNSCINGLVPSRSEPIRQMLASRMHNGWFQVPEQGLSWDVVQGHFSDEFLRPRFPAPVSLTTLELELLIFEPPRPEFLPLLDAHFTQNHKVLLTPNHKPCQKTVLRLQSQIYREG